MTAEKPSISRWTAGNYFDALAAYSSIVFPFIGAGIALADRDGRILSYLFNIQTPEDRLAAYIKALIALVALVAVALFTQRFVQLEKIRASIGKVEADLQQRLYPDGSISPFLISSYNFESFIREARKELIFIGLNLTTFLGSAYREQINQQLLNGRSVTVAIIDPTDQNLLAATNRSAVALGTTDYYRKNIDLTIDSLREFAARAKKSSNGARLKLVLLPFAPTFSLKALDPYDRDGQIIVELYPHRTPDGAPIFLLRSGTDRQWFEYFRRQIEILLESGRTVPLE